MSASTPSADAERVEIPADMKPHAGGDQPSDWSPGGDVLLRYGLRYTPRDRPAGLGIRARPAIMQWNRTVAAGGLDYDPDLDIIAYTPRLATSSASTGAGEGFLAELRRVNLARYEAWVEGADAGIMFDALELGGEVGELLNVVKKLEREERGWLGSRADPADFADECADVLICLDKLARHRGVDLEAATRAKFNATSEKVGLPHRLAALTRPSPESAASGENVAWPRHEAQALLNNLNARIDAAVEGGGASVPVFPGIAALHASLSAPSPVGVDREALHRLLDKHLPLNASLPEDQRNAMIEAIEDDLLALLTPQPSDRERVLEEAARVADAAADSVGGEASLGAPMAWQIAADIRARALSTPQTEAE